MGVSAAAGLRRGSAHPVLKLVNLASRRAHNAHAPCVVSDVARALPSVTDPFVPIGKEIHRWQARVAAKVLVAVQAVNEVDGVVAWILRTLSAQG